MIVSPGLERCTLNRRARTPTPTRHGHKSCSTMVSWPRCVIRYWTEFRFIGRPSSSRGDRGLRGYSMREHCARGHRQLLAASKAPGRRALEPSTLPPSLRAQNISPPASFPDELGGARERPHQELAQCGCGRLAQPRRVGLNGHCAAGPNSAKHAKADRRPRALATGAVTQNSLRAWLKNERQTKNGQDAKA